MNTVQTRLSVGRPTPTREDEKLNATSIQRVFESTHTSHKHTAQLKQRCGAHAVALCGASASAKFQYARVAFGLFARARRWAGRSSMPRRTRRAAPGATRPPGWEAPRCCSSAASS
eukprot:scaffold93319_cov63-Phaeocystis_antarctica.AAC.6